MFEIGRLCVKLAGRDAGNKCVVVDIVDENHCLIDGAVRRRKCNYSHLEPLEDKLDIKKGAAHDVVKAEFEKLGFELVDKKTKPQTERPKKQRVKKVKEEPEKKASKTPVKSKETKAEVKSVTAKETAPSKPAPAEPVKK